MFFGCQPDWIRNQLKCKPLDAPVKDFLDEIIQSGETLDVNDSVWWQPTEKDMEGRTCFPACFVALLGTSPVLQLLQFFTDELNQKFSRNPLGPQCQGTDEPAGLVG